MNTGSPRQLAALRAALALFLGFAGEARATVYISEFLADNQTTTKVDEDGDHADWLELWNNGASSVSLNNWYLTDTSGDLHKWHFPASTPSITLAAGGRLLIFASNKDRKLDVAKLHTNFRLSKSAGSYLALVQPDGLTIEHAYNGYPQQVQDISYGLPQQTTTQVLVAPGAPGKAKVPLSAADMPTTAPTWHSIAFNDTAWQSGVTGFGYDTAGTYGSLLGAGGDLQASMYLVNSTALVRIPFTVSNTSSITALVLKMKFDDGFNAYINGVFFNKYLPGGNVWDSAALIDRGGALTLAFQNFNPTVPADVLAALVNGTNVLAIQLLNKSNGSTQDLDAFNQPNGSRTLCLPQLEATVTGGIGAPAYLLSVTPGAPNSDARTALGPSVSQTTDKLLTRPSGGTTSLPIVITTKVVPSLNPLNANDPVQLKYRMMQNTEVSVPMRDNGLAPDTIAGDTIYAAQIPTVNVGVGQMIRWRVEAKDTANTAATEPPFLDTTDNDQYYGTVTDDGITTSQLPILHWFVADAAASQTEGGTRCSLYYKAIGDTEFRFYDNVFVGLHGQSSSGFATSKKSHDFNFSEDNRFKWKQGEIQQRAVNMITTYADKSHVRDTLAWETWMNSKHVASHWSNLVRVQQNGVFWGIYDMVENGDEDFPHRAGLDPAGALYKCYNSLQDSVNVEKKSRDFEGNADLDALETGLNASTLASRRQFAYDNVDVPTLVNYLAANVMVENNDFGHKNYYVYRDTNGTREWLVLPWDEDLSFGHTWTGSQNYFNDDIDTQRNFLMGAATGNRLMNLIMNSVGSGTMAPEMVSMFLRRVRTLMDQFYVSAAATDGPLEQRVNQMLDQMDPPGAAYLTDADLDFRQWGYWLDGGGSPIEAGSTTNDAATHIHGPRKSALRITDNPGHTGNPVPSPYPGAVNNAEGLGDTTPAFMYGRRNLFYGGSLTLNSQPIPSAQPVAPTGLTIEYVDANPPAAGAEIATQNNEREFFIIRNNSANYIDISGWKLTGAVTYTFRGGTVIPPFTAGSAVNATGDVHAGRLHVARNPYFFRQRVTSPKGAEYRLVVGPYEGQLSARGETINLVIPGATPAQDVIAATTTYAAAATAGQNFLRVTELNYAPAAPSAAEVAALPGVQAGDFEFIELLNTGASPLALGGASFDKGITFTFPNGYSLAAGARVVLVSLQAAFQLRYGTGATIAGVYDGNFDNAGERVRLLDSVGEEILDFTYDPAWYPPTAGGGYSLVTRMDATSWDQYQNTLSWAISGGTGGTPGAGDAGSFSQVFEGWRHSYFTSAEEANAALAGLTADADADLDTNFYEYAYGTNPRQAAGHAAPEAIIVNDSGTNYGAIRFVRAKKAIDVTYTVEVNANLNNPAGWSAVNFPVGTPTDLGGGLERVTYRDSQPASSAARFLRVRAVK